MSDQKPKNKQNEPAGEVTRRETDETIAHGIGDPDFAQAETSDGSRSVLNSLQKTLDSVPRVVLRDEDRESNQSPAGQQSEETPPTDSSGRYQVSGEIARGGMGAVLKGRDTDLGRDLAIKVLLADHKERPEVISRFIEEAQIGGQLQHPGIAPVYELGQFPDERPFFSMKLVQGKTLATLLTERKESVDDRSKFLSIFEQICQTMAYAHNRGVIPVWRCNTRRRPGRANPTRVGLN